MLTPRVASVLLVTAALFVSAVHPANAQERRRSPGGGGPPPPPPAGTAVNRRFPFAGVWDGSRSFQQEGSQGTVSMVFAVSDSAKGVYDGSLVMPDGGRIPFPNAASGGGVLTWESPNSGGGKWVYTARLAGLDTLKGQAVLKGAPWNPSPEPVEDFLLVRRAPAAR